MKARGNAYMYYLWSLNIPENLSTEVKFNGFKSWVSSNPLENVLIEEMLQLLISKIDAKLLKAANIEIKRRIVQQI